MVLLHTTGCPKCEILKIKLESKNIPFETNYDTEIMLEKGFLEAPMLEVDEYTCLNLINATKWVNNYEG